MSTALALAGCGARTGLLTCGNGGVGCPSIAFGQNKVVCACHDCKATIGPVTILGPFAGNLPMCLPPNLNSDQTNLSAFDAGSYASAVDNFCSGAVENAVPVIARTLLDQCGLGTVSCTCDTLVENGVAATAEVPSCASPCGEVDCNSSNCQNPLLDDGGIDPTRCNCNAASACGVDSGVICRPGPGEQDPPTLESGPLTQFMSAPSTLDIEPSQSSLNATATFNDMSNNPHSASGSTKLHGHLTTYGVPHADGSADVLLELFGTADPVTFTFNNVGPFNSSVSATLQNIRLAGGAGETTIHLDSSGNGMIAPNALAITANFEQQGNTVSIDGGTSAENETFIAGFVNKDFIKVHVDWSGKTFSIPSFPFSSTANGISGTIQIGGTISNQPPSPKVSAPATVECTSPVGSPVTLDASGTTDPDANIVGTAWALGEGFYPATVFSHDLTTTRTQPIGTALYTFFAADSQLAMSFSRASVTVEDKTPPVLTATLSPACLWPPNHTLVLFELGKDIPFTVSDTCDPSPTVEIENVISNETTKFQPNIEFGKKGLCIRSDRDGSIKTDRTYTITLSAKDAYGNQTLKSLTVTVPHDQKNDCPNVGASRIVLASDSRCTEN